MIDAEQPAKPQSMVSTPGSVHMSTRAVALSVDNSLGTKLLPGVLSVVAGSVDVISFLGLGGLFAAHVTGNLVVLAAHVVTGRVASLALILSLPVFVAVLGLTRLVAAWIEETGHGPLQPLLAVQLVLLVSLLAVWVTAGSVRRSRCSDSRCCRHARGRCDGGAERTRAVVGRRTGDCGDDDRHHDVHDGYRRDVVPARS